MQSPFSQTCRGCGLPVHPAEGSAHSVCVLVGKRRADAQLARELAAEAAAEAAARVEVPGPALPASGAPRPPKILTSGHHCCGCGGLCDSGHPCPMSYNCWCRTAHVGLVAAGCSEVKS